MFPRMENDGPLAFLSLFALDIEITGIYIRPPGIRIPAPRSGANQLMTGRQTQFGLTQITRVFTDHKNIISRTYTIISRVSTARSFSRQYVGATIILIITLYYNKIEILLFNNIFF